MKAGQYFLKIETNMNSYIKQIIRGHLKPTDY
jgi:hypothetical protein